MDLPELLGELERLGVEVHAQEASLVVRGRNGALPSVVRDALVRHKPALLRRLSPPRPVPREGPMALSFAQQRLWFLDQLGSGIAYNLPLALHIKGRLDVPALEAALGEIVRRHEALRTTFPTVDGRAVQIVSPPSPMSLPVLDLSGRGTAALEEARGLTAEEALRPFDLARGPLLRGRLHRLREDEYVLSLTIHHIVFDGWSMGIFNRELAALYAAFVDGRPSSLPELPVQYADFTHWQRERLQGEALDRQLSFWRERLEGAPSRLDLPTDRPRSAALLPRGAAYDLVFPPSLVERLRALSHREGVTLYTILLAGLKSLLHRHSGQDDIVVGTASANRTHSELEGLIGFFVNSLALRTDFSGDPTFREVLGRVKAVAREAFDHEELPFEKLVDALNPDRDPGQNPIFQVLCEIQRASSIDLKMPGLRVSPFDLEARVARFARFDLEVHFFEHEDRSAVAAQVLYNAELFDAATIERLVRHYLSLLEEASARPETRLSRLPLLSEGERARAVREWNDTRAEYPRMALGEAFVARVDETPHAPAVAHGGAILTYGELNRRANRLAHHLMRLGVAPEVRVGLCVERSADLVVSLLAIVKAGGAYVPLDPEYPEERLRFMLEDSGARILLTQESLRAALPEGGLRVVSLDRDAEAIGGESEANPRGHATADHLAYVIYTSGSTGVPKGVAVPQRAIARLVLNTDYVRLDSSDRVAQAANASFDAATFEVWGPLLNGGRVVVLDRDVVLSPPELAAAIRNEGITTLFLTTALFHRLALEAPEAFAPLRHLLFGGEAVDPACVRAVLERGRPQRLLHVYGPTETTTFSTWHHVPEVAAEATTVPIGRPIANTTQYVLDGHLEPVPVGVAGELFIGGDGLARGYWNRPELTAERFVPDPFGVAPGARLYRTGDLVRQRPDGSVEFVGRKDHQVKLRGFRIELGEIEAALLGHPAVKHAVVMVREDQPGDRRLVGYVVPAGGAPETCGEPADLGEAVPVSFPRNGGQPRPWETYANEPPAGTRPRGLAVELRTHLQERLPEYMVPSALALLERLPLSPNGKVDREALGKVEVARPESEEAREGPRTPVEQELARIWAQVLGVERVGIDDNFFDLGGDSILSIQIIARANQAGLRLTPKQVFQAQTIRELAAVVGTTEVVVAEQGLLTGPVPLTPIQAWFFEQGLEDAHHFNNALLLEVLEPLGAGVLSEAVRALQEHHDALRLRFKHGPGGWGQEIAGLAEPPFQCLDLSGVRPGEEPAAITDAASLAQRSLDLARGPLWRVVLLDFGSERLGRLLIVVHHLAIDGVSWRILGEDLERACRQLRAGGPVKFPPKTTSFRRWAEQQRALAESDALREEASVWHAMPAEHHRLPVDFEGAASAGTVAQARDLTLELAEAETRALLQEVPTAFDTTFLSLLLSALARAFGDWSSASSLRIDLESHGREGEGLDLSRTVGWLTAIHPFVLRLSGEPDSRRVLASTEEQLRKVPRLGIGYGTLRYLAGDAGEDLRRQERPQVAFNYLGQFDSDRAEAAPFKPAREAVGPQRSLRGKRAHLIEINAKVAERRLQVTWTYDQTVHRRETIETVARGFEGHLLRFVEESGTPASPATTVIDASAADLSAQDMDALIDELGEMSLPKAP